MIKIVPEGKVQMVDQLEKLLKYLFNYIGVSEGAVPYFRVVLLIVIVAVLARFSHKLANKYIVKYIEAFFERTKSKYDDYLVKHKVLRKVAYLVPALIVYLSLDFVFEGYLRLNLFFTNTVFVYFVVVILLSIDALFKAVHDIYESLPFSKNRPIKGYLQGIQLVFVLVGILVIISIILETDLTKIFTGLGAVAAVLILVFKDTILGFVASIQLFANNMVKPGDWISMPSHKADGTVQEITLNTVKVQNWDKTITTIPTYALVSDSFQNWKGMEESGGRRIKRSISIDMKSVKFCTPTMIEKFRKIKVLNEYIERKLIELDEYNRKFEIDDEVLVNGRRMTNLGIFRKYLEAYLKYHPKIHDNMTFLVRHLQPNEKGIPLEIYVFSKDQEWAKYEAVQASIFDHILAVIPEFELKVYQFPTENSSANYLND